MTSEISIEVEYSRDLPASHEYAIRVLLEDFLDFRLQVRRVEGDHDSIRLRMSGTDAVVAVPIDTVPSPRRGEALKMVELPDLPAGWSPHPNVPVVQFDGRPVPRYAATLGTPGHTQLGFDVFRAAFHFLSREEEVVNAAAIDEHGRFPASAALLVRTGMQHRPVVDEYADLVARCLGVRRDRVSADRSFRVWCTHDVDNAFVHTSASHRWIARTSISRLVRGRPKLAARGLFGGLGAKWFGERWDPSNTFGQIMDLAEDAGIRSTFNFIADSAPVARLPHAAYEIDSPLIRALMHRIVDRGHEIGLHPSYGAHLCSSQLRAEVHGLERALRSVGIRSPTIGGRHHYLRWDSRQSVGHWADAGLAYDSSIGFAEHPGFRAGAARPFRLFDWGRQRISALWERPLVLMDAAIVSPTHLGLDPLSDQACVLVEDMRGATRVFGGEFTVLWHNDVLMDPRQWPLFRLAVAGR